MIRAAIWRNYRKGQERDKLPSREYVVALHAALSWWMTKDILTVIRSHGISEADIEDVRYRLERTEYPLLREIWEQRLTLFDRPDAALPDSVRSEGEPLEVPGGIKS